MKSREQGLINKGMRSNTYKLFLNFKTVLYSNAIVVKGFNISRKLF